MPGQRTSTSPHPSAALEAPAARSLGWCLRRISGADEDLIREYPASRNRYTALGGVIIGTGCIATISMWFAITRGLEESPLVAAVAALAWGAFIVNLDRWLTTGIDGHQWYAPLKYVSRMVMAVIFALVIAEPFVLQVFSTAIEDRVVDDRIAENKQIESSYKLCNPLPGQDTGGAPCPDEDYRLSIAGEPVGEQEVADLTAQMTTMQQALSADRQLLADQQELAQAECTGAVRPGVTSGILGEGPNCRREQAEAASLKDSLDIDARQAQVDDLQAKISLMTSDRHGQQVNYEGKVKDAIREQTDAEQKDPERKIGLLERFAALEHLSSPTADGGGEAGRTIGLAALAIRALFITIECLPIFVKWISGDGPYEEALRERETSARRIDTERALARESRETLAPKIALLRDQDLLDRTEKDIRIAQRIRDADRNAELSARIESLRHQILESHRRTAGPPHRANGVPRNDAVNHQSKLADHERPAKKATP